MPTKKIPQRQCLACRQMRPKRQLIRVVRSKEGEVSLDTTGKKPGRGAYVCPNRACLQKLLKSHALERAFGCPVSPQVTEALEKEWEAQALDG